MSDAHIGQASATAGNSDFNAISFVVQQLLGRRSFCALVQVVACTNNGGVAAAGTVDVQPLVNQVDGQGNAMPHGVVYKLPYFRLIGGQNAIINDPQAGDLGLCVFADRDTSSVRATQAQANPGSRRRNDWADGIYIGGILNGVPTQFIQFNGSNVTITSQQTISLNAPTVQINAPAIQLNGAVSQSAGSAGSGVSLIGPVSVTNDVTASGTSLHSHRHGGVQTGSGSTGVPT